MYKKKALLEIENFCKSVSSSHQWINEHLDKTQNCDVHVFVIFLSNMEKCREEEDKIIRDNCKIEGIINLLQKCGCHSDIIERIQKQLIHDVIDFY